MTGGAYGAKVVPVRVLGRGGASLMPKTDLTNSMFWAAGLPAFQINGDPVDPNPNPAQILNLSLGNIESQCPKTYQDAIDVIRSKGVVIIASAGNADPGKNPINVANITPANCAGVIAVAAKGPTNQLASYSNYGAVTITASGGDMAAVHNDPLGDIYSTIWSLKKSYYTYPYAFDPTPDPLGISSWQAYHGTSMAAPHVAAAAAILIGIFKANKTTYSSDTITTILKNNTQTYINCYGWRCATDEALDVNQAVTWLLANIGMYRYTQYFGRYDTVNILNNAIALNIINMQIKADNISNGNCYIASNAPTAASNTPTALRYAVVANGEIVNDEIVTLEARTGYNLSTVINELEANVVDGGDTLSLAGVDVITAQTVPSKIEPPVPNHHHKASGSTNDLSWFLSLLGGSVIVVGGICLYNHGE